MAKIGEAPRGRRLDVAFISSNLEWGGSEDLWSGTAVRLAEEGHRVRFYKNILPRGIGDLDRLRGIAKGTELARIPLFPTGYYWPTRRFARPLDIGCQALRLYASLRFHRRPDLAIVSQGGNHDGWPFAAICRHLRIRYVLISHKATDLYWPSDAWRSWVDRIYAGCPSLLLRVQSQPSPDRGTAWADAAARLDRPQSLPSPREGGDAWPDAEDGLRLACVARLSPQEKGQDVLLRVLALPKWRNRPISVTFFGDGEQRQGLEAMARYHRLANVAFAGQVKDVAGIWTTHHALVLPSRAEGLPLTIVEAMLCGRVPIVSDVGGNAEVVSDGETGFLAASATERDFDAALERAWQRRAEWPAIGAEAARSIRRIVPADPAQVFSDALVGLANRNATGTAQEILPLAAE